MSPEEMALHAKLAEMVDRCTALEFDAMKMATTEPMGHRRKALRRASANLLKAAETFEALAPDECPF